MFEAAVTVTAASPAQPGAQRASRQFLRNAMTTTEQEVNIKKLASRVRAIKVPMLTAVNSDGSLRSRLMAMQEAEFDGTLWFFTRENSWNSSEIKQYPNVNLSYEFCRGASLCVDLGQGDARA